MQTRSIARELALLVLGQIRDESSKGLEVSSSTPATLLHRAMETLRQHWSDGLDSSAKSLEIAQQQLLDSELQESNENSIRKVRAHLRESIIEVENALNSLSSILDLPKLLALSDQDEIRIGAMKRVNLVLEHKKFIDSHLDDVMEGWRLKRLPRIDQDILRLAVVDLINLQTPLAVTCNEAVDLANRYSDEQGRRMINGILRRLQKSSFVIKA